MTKRFITDEDLTIATAMVSEAMLRSLPEPEDCTGQFTSQFEEKIEKLKKAAARKANWKKFALGSVAAVLVILIGFSMLCVFNTEVRAAVGIWFKETFGTYTTYWFTSAEDSVLPKYELTWVPEGFEKIFEESYEQTYGSVYQHGSSAMDSFTFDYNIATDDMKLTVQSLYGSHKPKQVDINGQYGEFYLSSNPADTNTLVWFDEENNIVFIITSYLDQVDVLHIANSVNLVN